MDFSFKFFNHSMLLEYFKPWELCERISISSLFKGVVKFTRLSVHGFVTEFAKMLGMMTPYQILVDKGTGEISEFPFITIEDVRLLQGTLNFLVFRKKFWKVWFQDLDIRNILRISNAKLEFVWILFSIQD